MLKDVLKNGLAMSEVLPCFTIQLPKYSWLSDREYNLFAGYIDKYAFEDFVQIKRFAGRVLEMPAHAAIVGVEREGRTGVKDIIQGAVPSADWHPRLGLCDAPKSKI